MELRLSVHATQICFLVVINVFFQKKTTSSSENYKYNKLSTYPNVLNLSTISTTSQCCEKHLELGGHRKKP